MVLEKRFFKHWLTLKKKCNSTLNGTLPLQSGTSPTLRSLFPKLQLNAHTLGLFLLCFTHSSMVTTHVLSNSLTYNSMNIISSLLHFLRPSPQQEYWTIRARRDGRIITTFRTLDRAEAIAQAKAEVYNFISLTKTKSK